MVVVLNQADRLDDRCVEACRADLGRLLAEDGLPGLPVLALSARDGRGLAALRDRCAASHRRACAAVARLTADVTAAAAGLDAGCDGRAGDGSPARRPSRARRTRSPRPRACRSSRAPSPARTAATGASRRLAVRALRRPLQARPAQAAAPRRQAGPGRPTARSRARSAAQARQALRGTHAARTAAGGSYDPGRPWSATRRCGPRTDFPSGSTASSPASTSRRRCRAGGPRRRLVQRALAVVAAAGALWLDLLAGLGALQLGDVIPLPDWHGIPSPTLLLGAGVLLGLLLAALARWANRVGGGRRACPRDAHLHLGERRAEAAPHAAAERDPGVGRRARRRGSARGGRRTARDSGRRACARARSPASRRSRRQHVAVDAQLAR